VTKVDEPSQYGVIVTQPGGTFIQRFVEKPADFVGDRINAGIYMFNPSVLKRIRPEPTSIEKEVFPQMAQDGELHCFDLQGYWMDVGQPKDYLTGVALYLSSLESKGQLPDYKHLDSCTVQGNVLIDPTAKIGRNCVLGPNVTIGPNVIIEEGVRIHRAAILEGAHIKAHSYVHSSIVGWKSKVGRWVRMDNGVVLGDDVSVKDELYVNGAIVLPNKSLTTNVPEPQIIM
jgi:mannose-1-phosphate guanylyltransferase